MSDSDQLIILSQLLLANDIQVVETSCQLIKSLIEHNEQANHKLYLTGLFYFSCRYSSNNFLPIAQLFEISHLRQSFYDGSNIHFSTSSANSSTSAGNNSTNNSNSSNSNSNSNNTGERPASLVYKSILSLLLPEALINTLIYYGAEKFSSVFVGTYDTPEVIWDSSLRQHLIEMIDIHLGNFILRLKQYNLAKYDYCPLPKVHYSRLEKELYIHEYYLRNLCDEVRYPNYTINEPLLLLREVIQRWRKETSVTVEDLSISDAKKFLGRLMICEQ